MRQLQCAVPKGVLVCRMPGEYSRALGKRWRLASPGLGMWMQLCVSEPPSGVLGLRCSDVGTGFQEQVAWVIWSGTNGLGSPLYLQRWKEFSRNGRVRVRFGSPK